MKQVWSIRVKSPLVLADFVLRILPSEPRIVCVRFMCDLFRLRGVGPPGLILRWFFWDKDSNPGPAVFSNVSR